MKLFHLFENGIIADIICESSAPKGVQRVANTVAEDLLLVTGKKAKVIGNPEEADSSRVVFAATLGQSDFIKEGFAGFEESELAGKRECYSMKLVENPFPEFPQVKEALVILGSDKRGTLYGLFRLSELCGVSPMVFWGDAAPAKKDKIELEFSKVILTKEPSIKYRGFFINDEWPAFGGWCTEQFGDVNAKAYDKIFELVIRLKGNYMWPAMWNSSFSEDGPGIENARLADEYGVIMGASHHEPMCRAGVEWQNQYQEYGEDNTWSFVSNKEAITEFWKKGIERNKDFENIITIGMRGENDSMLMGEDATFQDNVNVLKNAIQTQHQLMKEVINPDLKEVPRMLAIYKEVEDFYFGVNGEVGLKGWEEIDDVIFLYCEDNQGNLRAIPQPGETHPGGYGLYYHFDYHGGPTSYEFLNNTNLAKAWEQLTMAYEYGIREMWIVNVGDIKGKEYPLNFFMDLAYDYDTWGLSNPESAAQWTRQWVDVQFGDMATAEQKERIRYICDEYSQWSAAHIPESLNPSVFKNSFHEIERAWESITGTMEEADVLRRQLAPGCIPAYESLVYFTAMASLNSILVNLAAGLNHLQSERGALVTNYYGKIQEEKINLDRFYVDEFHSFKGGKWNHMMDSAHMCFRTWDDNNWTYPPIHAVKPIPGKKIMVSFRGYEPYNVGRHWQDPAPIANAEMMRPDCNDVIFDIDSRGDVDFAYRISCDKPWLSFSITEGKSNLEAQPRITVVAHCDRNKLEGTDTARIEIEFDFVNRKSGGAVLGIMASNQDQATHSGAFLETQDYICIPAQDYTQKHNVDGMGWKVIPQMGRKGDAGLKSFPVTKNWEGDEKRPYVQYEFIATQSKEYTITFYLSPRNPMVKGGTIKGCYAVNKGEPELLDTVPAGYYAEHFDADWAYGTTNQIRKVDAKGTLHKGLNSLKFFAADPNVVLERIVLAPVDKPIAETHLAPPASYRIP